MKTKRIKKPKALTYELIPQDSEVSRPIYALLDELVKAHHDHLREARIALAWNTAWKPDVDGRVTLGLCKKASPLDRELAPYDFVIVIRKEFWLNLSVTAQQRRALLDHELCHAAVKYDDAGEPEYDARGRVMYRIRRHDLEEFEAIASRYGCWKRDIEAFAQALSRADRKSSTWIGYTSLHEALKEIGLDVPVRVIATWPDDERREVLTWTLLRKDAGVHVNIGLSQTMPACLAAVVRQPVAQAADDATTH